MRTHGWGGARPASDDEARERIVLAARAEYEQTGRLPTVSSVATALSVSRQTVYRYFPTVDALLAASAADGVTVFLDDIAEHAEGTTTPAEAVCEAIAYCYEELGRRPDLAVFLAALLDNRPGRGITSAMPLALGRSMLGRFPVDWAAAGYDEEELGELVEHMLRVLQSLVADPGDPPRSPAALRAYLHRWLGRAVAR